MRAAPLRLILVTALAALGACGRSASPIHASALVTVDLSGAGTIVSDPPGISCPGKCSAPFVIGDVVTLMAAPATGASVQWGGDCVGISTPCSFPVVGPSTTQAHFG